ncbi:CheB methylesterase domain-containing protein [Solirhodobacter olei]|uniref:CheB methylesterase domain-containing protein n=1 Tax=Solirhodobacter olei TaxID=2493082 RepID=UPI0013E3C08E|nr:CheB methylesterase domain-containing protein [Solirhodobacter olei]
MLSVERDEMQLRGPDQAEREGPGPGGIPQAHRITSLIVIGSSTGGVDALHEILGAFPRDCPPTLIVQHISGPFSASMTRGLAARCRAEVVLAEDRLPVVPGQIVVAPGNSHHTVLALTPRPICRLVDRPPLNGHRPSIDELFRSCALLGPVVRAALLTGMGRDGAEGMRAIKNAGGRTLAQDEASSIIFGMARVARELGAVGRMLPLDGIAGALLDGWEHRA